MIEWKLIKKKISDLKENPKNPRSLSKEQAKQLKTSLERFGISDKPIINQNGTIIGGHQRLRILKKMGYQEIDCWMPEIPLSDQEVEELCLRLNKNTGEFDFDILANEFNYDDLIEFGFEEKELLGCFKEEIEEEFEKKETKKDKSCPHCGGIL